MLAVMAVSVTVLASGSKGNCTVISSSGTRLLVDAGLSCSEVLRRMLARAESIRMRLTPSSSRTSTPTTLAGCTCWPSSRFRFTSRHRPITRIRSSARDSAGNRIAIGRLETFCSGTAFQIGDIKVTPFTIPHDAVDPVGFTFCSDGIKIGVCTDLGYMPASVRHHSARMSCADDRIEPRSRALRGGPYPWSVKQRVMSRVGHLSNDALADFLTNDYDGAAEFLILAHLSEQNNHPEIARMTAERALSEQRSWFRNHLLLAAQHEPLPAVRL